MGISQREAWRRFVMGSVEPLLERSWHKKLKRSSKRASRSTCPALWAHDLAGRASSFKAMVVAGMALDRAAALSGLMATPE